MGRSGLGSAVKSGSKVIERCNEQTPRNLANGFPLVSWWLQIHEYATYASYFSRLTQTIFSVLLVWYNPTYSRLPYPFFKISSLEKKETFNLDVCVNGIETIASYWILYIVTHEII